MWHGQYEYAGWVECPRYCTGARRGDGRGLTQSLSTQSFSQFPLQVFLCRNMVFCKKGEGGACCCDLPHRLSSLILHGRIAISKQLAFLCSLSPFSCLLSILSFQLTLTFLLLWPTSGLPLFKVSLIKACLHASLNSLSP